MNFPILTESRIMYTDKQITFVEAINILSEQLEVEGYMTSNYKNTILHNLATNGPYFVLAPKIALPHSQNSEEVMHTGISVLKVKDAVDVGGAFVNVFVLLASISPETHMDLLVKMVSLMDTEEKQHEFVTCDLETLKTKMMALV